MSDRPSSLDQPSAGLQLALWMLLAVFLISIIGFGLAYQRESPAAPVELTHDELAKLDRIWHLLGAADAKLVGDLTEDASRLQEAGDLLSALEKEIPGHRRVLFYRGLERLAVDDYEAARGSLEKAAQAVGPDGEPSLPLLLTLSAALTHLKDYVGAEAVLRRAAEVDPNSPAVWGNLGQVLWLLGRQDESIEAYRKKLQLEGIPTLPRGPV